MLLTNGVDEAIHVLCQAFLDRGDAMLLPVPTYSMYEVYGSAAEAQIDAVPAATAFVFPLDAMLRAIHPRTRLIAIANPNSPTGATVARDAIVAIAERAPQAVVLVDEAYYHFFGETVMDLIGKLPNLVVARTFSKAYGLAGLRLGALDRCRRDDAVAAARDLALQRESAGACMFACRARGPRLSGLVCGGGEGGARGARAGADGARLEHWPSEANFILTRIGARARRVCEGDARTRHSDTRPLCRSGLRWAGPHHGGDARADAAGACGD